MELRRRLALRSSAVTATNVNKNANKSTMALVAVFALLMLGAQTLINLESDVIGVLPAPHGGTGNPAQGPALDFVDVNASGFTISSNAQSIAAYLDCSPGGGVGHCNSIAIADGAFDGQLLIITCNSAFVSSSVWAITGDFTNFSTINLGGAPAGSYDSGGTFVDGSQASCGATLMYSNANGVWELNGVYGGSVS